MNQRIANTGAFFINNPMWIYDPDLLQILEVNDAATELYGYSKQEMKVPTRNHIHTVVRTPNGNDYGKDLLDSILKKTTTIKKLLKKGLIAIQLFSKFLTA